MAWKAFRALFFVLIIGYADAGSYDDYTKGLSALSAGRYDLAIQSLSTALNAGDLATPYIPIAHLRRASAYMAIGNCKSAISDFNAPEAAQKTDTEYVFLRLQANLCIGDRAAADRDFSKLLTLRPTAHHASIYSYYAIGLWTYGDFSAAGQNFVTAMRLAEPKRKQNIYFALLYAMTAQRAGQFDMAAFNAFAEKLPSDWPMPVLNFYRGTITVDEVYRAAADSGAVQAAEQKCEADFYIGEWNIAHGDKIAGAPRIHLAAENCPHTFTEYNLAHIEEKRLTK